MSLLSGWERVVAWVNRKEPATALAWVRIFIGVTVVWTLYTVWAGDLVEWLWMNPQDGGYRELGGSWLVAALGGPSPRLVWSLFWVAMVTGMMVAVGFGGRLVTFVCLQSFMGVTDINGHAGGSYDELIDNALWLLVLSPASQTWSVDARLWTGRWVDDTPKPAFVRDLIVYQLVLMYWTTGLQKLSADWTPGNGFSALYYILQQPTWHRFNMRWLAWVYPLTQIGTAVSWFWEITAPLWLLGWWFAHDPERPGRVRALFNRLRVVAVYAGLGLIFHLAIHATMDVGPFSFASLALYPALLHPRAVQRLLRWIPPMNSEKSSLEASNQPS